MGKAGNLNLIGQEGIMRIIFRAQGATEYLVLLAVVLIVALVSVALLGFFPGMASDAQIAQSQAYWQSATPIAVSGLVASLHTGYGTFNFTEASFRIKNTGSYPLQITKIIGGGTAKTNTYCGGNCPPGGAGNYVTFANSPFFKLAPGEERLLGYDNVFGNTPSTEITFDTSGGGMIAKSICQNDSSRGTLFVEGFGFEYIEYIEGQQITKRQIGAKPLIAKCR